MIDSELLHEWAARRNEAAFAELVRRYLGLVHASARRQVGASPLADDVAQAVFLVLARKAGSLGPKVVLSGWLFRTTRFVAARALRAELRRSMHETAAAMQTTAAAAIPEHWREAPWTTARVASRVRNSFWETTVLLSTSFSKTSSAKRRLSTTAMISASLDRYHRSQESGCSGGTSEPLARRSLQSCMSSH